MFEPGRYWIGDLCYVLNEKNDFNWGKVLDDTGYFNIDEDGGIFDIVDNNGRKHKVACFNTMWGDGVYFDQNGREYGVDAGLIGMILESSLKDVGPKDGHIYEFENVPHCYSQAGVLRFGEVFIDTMNDEEEDNESW